MVTLYIENDIDKIGESTDFITLEEEIHLKIQEGYYPVDLDLISKLSMYGDIYIFHEQEINALIDISDEMIQYTWQLENESSVKSFFLKLYAMCNEALQNNNSIIAISD
jgi:hypothetical protein